MPISIPIGSIFLVTSIAIATTAAADTQCVSIRIHEFNLAVDGSCSISDSALVQSELPDQVLLGSLGIANTCFTIISPSGEASVQAEILNEETGETVQAEVSGVAGLTLNAYSSPPVPPPVQVQSFTAVTRASIVIDGSFVGTLVSRDAGTIFVNVIENPLDDVAAARLSIAAGTKKLTNVTGHIDEVGKEFDPFEPASASGKLCGPGLADRLL